MAFRLSAPSDRPVAITLDQLVLITLDQLRTTKREEVISRPVVPCLRPVLFRETGRLRAVIITATAVVVVIRRVDHLPVTFDEGSNTFAYTSHAFLAFVALVTAISAVLFRRLQVYALLPTTLLEVARSVLTGLLLAVTIDTSLIISARLATGTTVVLILHRVDAVVPAFEWQRLGAHTLVFPLV
jgi:hypothetical protein